MSAFFLRLLDSQPQEAVEINWSNPITAGLAAVYVPGVGARNHVNNTPWIVTNPTFPGYLIRQGNGSLAYYQEDSIDGLYNLTGVSPAELSFVQRTKRRSAGNQRLVQGKNGASGVWGTLLSYSAGNVIPRFTLNGVADYDGAAFVDSDRWVSFGVSCKTSTASGIKLFINGSLNATHNSGAASGGDRVVNAGGFGAERPHDFLYIWRRILSAEEHRSINDEPWQVFEPQRIYIPVAAAASGASGTLATTNANDTSAAAGTSTIVGTLARTNGADTSAASGTVTVVGTLATTNAADTSAASGVVGGGATGTLARTNANDTAAAVGVVPCVGTLAYTNGNDSCVAYDVAPTAARRVYKLDEQPQLGNDPNRMRIVLTEHIRNHAREINRLKAGFFSPKLNTATAAPTTGTWGLGDFIANEAPAELGTAASKYVIEGWTCIAAGTPGTFVEKRFLTGN